MKMNGRSAGEIFDSIFCKHPLYTKAVGFKIFYYHPIDDKSGLVWDELLRMGNLHVVHLKRRNILRTLLSRKIAGKTESWFKIRNEHQPSVDEKMVQFTVEELLEAFERTRKMEITYGHMFQSKPIIEIYYEDIVMNPEKEMRTITEMLGLKSTLPKSRFQKQNPEKMSELIQNYDELRRALSNTEWSSFFDE